MSLIALSGAEEDGEGGTGGKEDDGGMGVKGDDGDTGEAKDDWYWRGRR
jgi:hypothetical protein